MRLYCVVAFDSSSAPVPFINNSDAVRGKMNLQLKKPLADIAKKRLTFALPLGKQNFLNKVTILVVLRVILSC